MDILLSELKQHYSIKVKYKNDSILMKIISIILFFNRGFMTNYITTIGNTIYLPSDSKYWPQDAILSTIAHEFVHIDDEHKDKLYKLKYLFPQIIAPLFLILLPWCWWLALILFVICLGPLPAPWRKRYELRAYKMSLVAFSACFDGIVSEDKLEATLYSLVKFHNKAFTGFGYWLMWPWGVKRDLDQTVQDIKTGDIFSKDSVYKIGYDAVKKSK